MRYIKWYEYVLFFILPKTERWFFSDLIHYIPSISHPPSCLGTLSVIDAHLHFVSIAIAISFELSLRPFIKEPRLSRVHPRPIRILRFGFGWDLLFVGHKFYCSTGVCAIKSQWLDGGRRLCHFSPATRVHLKKSPRVRDKWMSVWWYIGLAIQLSLNRATPPTRIANIVTMPCLMTKCLRFWVGTIPADNISFERYRHPAINHKCRIRPSPIWWWRSNRWCCWLTPGLTGFHRSTSHKPLFVYGFINFLYLGTGTKKFNKLINWMSRLFKRFSFINIKL